MATKIKIKNFKKDIEIKQLHPGKDTFVVRGGDYYKTKSEHATSQGEKICPCCGTSNSVYIWSFSGGGKICDGCGVLLGYNGAIIELKKMTKQDLIDWILAGFKISINK